MIWIFFQTSVSGAFFSVIFWMCSMCVCSVLWEDVPEGGTGLNTWEVPVLSPPGAIAPNHLNFHR